MITSAARHAYNRTLRPLLPRKIGVLNNVAVREPRLLDRTDEFPGYEHAFCGLVRQAVTDGDAVVIVGGGRGVSAVHAAREGAGVVNAYEATARRVRTITETAKLNGVASRVASKHAVVGSIVGLPTGDADTGPRIDPTALPGCDVLALDCEGAEVEILGETDIEPRAVVVETHDMFGTSIDDVGAVLDGYERETALTDDGLADDGTAVALYRRVEP